MSTDTEITLAATIIAWIFTAGGLLTWARMSIKQLEKEIKLARSDLYRDVNGIGNRVRLNEEASAKRLHNISLACIIAAPAPKESEISDLLREGS